MKKYLPYLMLFFISASLSVTQFFMARDAVYCGAHIDYKIKAFCGFNNGMKAYSEAMPLPNWKSRVMSNYLAAKFVRMKNVTKKTIHVFADRVAVWHALWIFATMVLLVAFCKNKLLCVLGFAACLGYAWTPSIRPVADYMLMPWDAPVLFLWTSALLMYDKKFRFALLVLLAAGTFFTETMILLTIIPLFYNEIKLSHRLRYFIACFAIVFVCKFMCDALVGNPIPIFTCSTHYGSQNWTGHYWNCATNLHLLLHPSINYQLFSAGGIWAAIFILNKNAIGFKAISVYYALFLFFCAGMSELRLWQEFIPLFFVGYDKFGWSCRYE